MRVKIPAVVAAVALGVLTACDDQEPRGSTQYPEPKRINGVCEFESVEALRAYTGEPCRALIAGTIYIDSD